MDIHGFFCIHEIKTPTPTFGRKNNILLWSNYDNKEIVCCSRGWYLRNKASCLEGRKLHIERKKPELTPVTHAYAVALLDNGKYSELGSCCSLILCVAVTLGSLVIHTTQNYPLGNPFNCSLPLLGTRAWVMACTIGQSIVNCPYVDIYLISPEILLDWEVPTVPNFPGFFYKLKFHK